jgi:hypothetical protein
MHSLGFAGWVAVAISLLPPPPALAGEGAPQAAAVALANKADVLHDGLRGVAVTAVHVVADTAGRTEKQVYRVLNQLTTGASFIVISAENPELNGLVYLIKGSTLYAAAPNQRSFQRLGALNLDRRLSGSLFSHWDLQGNQPIGEEYLPSIGKVEGGATELRFAPKPGSHYQRIVAQLDGKLSLLTRAELYDEKGLLKTVAYSKPRTMGGKRKRRLMSLVEMRRAEGRTDLPVARTTLRLLEVELDPEVSYAEEMATTDANLQRLRLKYVLAGEAFRSALAESEE